MIYKNLLKTLAFIFSMAVFISQADAQNLSKTNSDSVSVHRAQTVFVEVGAAGLFFSANYDTRFSQRRDGFGGRIGMGAWGSVGTTFITFPFQFNYLSGGKSSFLELGAGGTILYTNNAYNENPLIGNNLKISGTYLLPTTTIGYRYQPYNGGFNFRISINPMLLEGTFIPYFGLSAGYTFK